MYLIQSTIQYLQKKMTDIMEKEGKTLLIVNKEKSTEEKTRKLCNELSNRNL